jgi:hypothetical protein
MLGLLLLVSYLILYKASSIAPFDGGLVILYIIRRSITQTCLGKYLLVIRVLA